jgi:hypothetical protein
LRPGLFEAWTRLGVIDLVEGNDVGAKENFIEALSWSPTDPLGHLGLAVALFATGEPTAGESEFSLAAVDTCDDLFSLDIVALRLQKLGLQHHSMAVRAAIEKRKMERANINPSDPPTSHRHITQ